MKRTPLKRGTKPLARRTKLGRGKWAKKEAVERRALRRAERWRRTFHSPEFVEWMQARACDCGCGRSPCEVHHEPPRSQGGTWTDTASLHPDCHRRRHRQGVKTFWRTVGKRYAEVTSRTQSLWLAHREGGA